MKISVITAAYNSADTIADTIESVLAQTHDDLEYIVIDGASTDNSMEIVRRYEPRFNGRMIAVSEPDKGIYDAMNKGIAMATGDVIGILNSDDFYSSPDVLECIARAIDDVDAVYADVHYVDPSDLTTSVRYYSSGSFRLWMMRLGFMPAHPTFYCRRDVYDRFGLYDPDFKVGADFELLLRILFKGRIHTRYIADDFVTMRTGGASSSGLQSHRRILRDHLQAYRKNNIYSNIALESLRYIYKIGELTAFRLGLFRNKSHK